MLWQFDNPAELILYSNLFISKAKNCFTYVINTSCYVDSLYGIRYTDLWGSFKKIENEDYILKHNTYHCEEQEHIFILNDSKIKSFSIGKNGMFYLNNKISIYENRRKK